MNHPRLKNGDMSTHRQLPGIIHAISRFSGLTSKVPSSLFLYALSAAISLAVWQGVSLLIANSLFLPGPYTVGQAWITMARSGELGVDTGVSLVQLVFGYGIGAIIGLLLALVAYSFKPIYYLLDPLLQAVRQVSAIAWIPIAILFFGIGDQLPIAIIAYSAALPLYVNALVGLQSVDGNLIRAAMTLGASRWLVVRSIVLPGALPLILTGARISLGLAWMVLIAAELIGSPAGLGYKVLWYQQFLLSDRVIAIMLTIGILGFAMDLGMRALQRYLFRWQPEARA